MLMGVDVSHWQGKMNWARAKQAGVKFAFIKATEGEDFLDNRLDENVEGLGLEDIPFGTYHYFRPTADAERQAEWYLRHNNGRWDVLDVEAQDGVLQQKLAAGVIRWLALVEQETKALPFIYTRASFWDPYVGAALGEHPLWVAHYDVVAPRLPVGWQDWTVWQYTKKGSGVNLGSQSASIDMNWARERLLEGDMPYTTTIAERPRADAELNAWKHPEEPAGTTFKAAEYYKSTKGLEWLRSTEVAPEPYTEKWYLMDWTKPQDADIEPDEEGLEVIKALHTLILFAKKVAEDG